MEGLVVVAVIWFVISQLINAGNMKKKQAAKGRAAPVEPAKPAPAVKPNAARTVRVKPVEGDGISDKAGCVGGSLIHNAHEGENRTAFAQMQPRAERADGAAVLTRKPTPSSVTAGDMRRAVVMAEVLGKPVAMRRGQPRLR